jgi:hypothetical protein
VKSKTCREESPFFLNLEMTLMITDDAMRREYRKSGAADDSDWALAIECYPDLLGHYQRLKRVSYELAFEYRNRILSEKKFGRRGDLAASMENTFFEEMFWKQP